MSLPDGSTTLTLNGSKAEEDRMRAALGLTPQHAHSSQPAEHGRHAARDHDGPVTVVSTRRIFDTADSSRARLATLTDELKAERSERVAAQQALADARQTIQQLQTKLAHTEMAAAEAFEAEQKARLAAEARLLAVTSEGDTLAEPRRHRRPPKVKQAAEPKRRGRPLKPRQATEKPAEPKRRGRPPGKQRAEKQPKQKPVQWWLPSYKAGRTASKT